MTYQIDLTQKSDTYISRPGAEVADRAYFLSAPVWKEKHIGVARQGSVFPTIGGGAVIQSYPRLTTGMPVTLEGSDKQGFIFTGEADKLTTMMTEGTALEFSDDAGVTKYEVYPDWSKDNPLELKTTDGYYRKVLQGTVYLIKA